MGAKLSSVNPYLRDPVGRKSMVIRSVVTSSAIEGIRAVFEPAREALGNPPCAGGEPTRRRSSDGPVLCPGEDQLALIAASTKKPMLAMERQIGESFDD
jgi:hypothetical protein